MSIQFAPLTGSQSVGALRATLPALDGRFASEAYTRLLAILPTTTSTMQGSVSQAAPTFLGVSAQMPPLTADFVGYYEALGMLDTTLPAVRFDAYSGTRLRAVIPPLRVQALASAAAYVVASIRLSAFAAAEYEAPMVRDELSVTHTMSSTWAVVVQSIALMADRPMVLARLMATLESSVAAQDLFSVVVQGTIAAQLDAQDLPTATLRMIYLLSEQLTLSDETVGLYNALVTVASAVVLADQLTPGLDGRLTDTVDLSDELAVAIAALVELADMVMLEDTLTPSLSLFAIVDDQFAVQLDQQALVAMLAELLDTVQLGMTLTTDAGETYIGYSVNVRVAAVSEYDNYPFNSMAVIGGLPFGAGPDGVYRLDGDDDDGQPIAASVYTGLTDFGNAYLKKLPAAWIGLTSDGDMVLKVVTTDKGRKKENWYRMAARPNGSPVDSRFTPAKGLEGRYWGFKLENIDGANFQLDSLKVWPLVARAQRRYSGR